MQRSVHTVLMLLWAAVFSAASVTFGQAKPASAAPVVLDDGIEITAIGDIPRREMELELFEGSSTAKERKLALVPGGKAPASVSFFSVKTGGKVYLIDVGFGNAIKEKLVDPAKIAGVIITHAHADHISGLLNEDGKANFNHSTLYISKSESGYWLDPKTPNSDLMKSIAEVYAGSYRTFSFGDTLAPGLVAVDAVGHTPGHTAFLLGTGKKKVLLAADFIHAAALQFPYPDESARFDMDKALAAKARKRLIQMALDNGWLLAGMHLPMPCYGSVKSNGAGGFDFTLGK